MRIYGRNSEGCRDRPGRWGQERELCGRNRRGEVDGGCLECRQIAQRGPGKKALQPRLLPSFKQHSRADLQSGVGCGGSAQLAFPVTPSPEHGAD